MGARPQPSGSLRFHVRRAPQNAPGAHQREGTAVSNPILTVFKIATFAILAFLVWITFWQGLRTEENIKDLKQRVAQLREKHDGVQDAERKYTDSVNQLSGEVRALKDLIASGAVGVRHEPPSNGGSAPPSNGGSAASSPTKHADGGPPAYFSDRAKALWGRFPNYLEPDPKDIQYPDWKTTPNLDSNGRMNCWYGSTPPDINPVTGSSGRLDSYIEEPCLRRLAEKHVEFPSKFKPELAIRAEHTPDYLEWVIWMRNDAYWHTPQLDLDEYPHLKGRRKVTAHDAKLFLDMVLHPKVNSSHKRSYYTGCLGAEVVDDFCLIIRWSKPQYQGIEYSLNIRPIPKHILAFDESGNPYDEGQLPLAMNDHWFYRAQQYVGCGPYYVASMDLKDHILFRRFDDYFGEKPPIREVYRKIFTERAIDIVKLEKGEHDYAGVTPDIWHQKVNEGAPDSPFVDGRIQAHWGWTNQYGYIGWKCTHPLFNDVRVRRAMTMACDRFRMNDTLNLGRGVVVTGPQHVNSMMYPPDLKPLPFDLERAAQLLAEAGWRDSNDDGVLDKVIDGNRRDFDFTATIPINQRILAMFEIFKEDLIKIGVKLDIKTMEWKQFKQEVLDSRKFECTSLLWGGDGWESDLSQIFHGRLVKEVPSHNFVEFSDPVADKLMDDLRLEFDPDKRVKMQRELHTRIAELQPYTFLSTIQMPAMYWQDRLGNWDECSRYLSKPFRRLYPLVRYLAK